MKARGGWPTGIERQKMNQKTDLVDLSDTLRAYKGKWILLSEDEHTIVYSADSMEDVLNKLERLNIIRF